VGRVPQRELCWRIHWGRTQERRRWRSLQNVREVTIRSVSGTYVPVIGRVVEVGIRGGIYAYAPVMRLTRQTAAPPPAYITCTQLDKTNTERGLYKNYHQGGLSQVMRQTGREMTIYRNASQRYVVVVSVSARALCQNFLTVSSQLLTPCLPQSPSDESWRVALSISFS
jgi:hypothetical protein